MKVEIIIVIIIIIIMIMIMIIIIIDIMIFFTAPPLLFQINLKTFLHVCEDLGLSAWQLFDPQDLQEQDNVM